MTYSVDNPPSLDTQAIAGHRTWTYKSADADGTVMGSDYFTNGDALGMKVNDLVRIVDTTTPLVSFAFVTAVTAGGAATAGTFAAVA